MRIKLCLGCAVFCWAFAPLSASAGVAAPLELCVSDSASPRDTLRLDLAPPCTGATLVKLTTARNAPEKPYWAAPNPNVKKAIIVILANSEPATVFDTIDASLSSTLPAPPAISEKASTWLVGLRFVNDVPTSNFLRWTAADGGSHVGNVSTGPVTPTVPFNVQLSAFDVVDFVLQKMKVWAPNITEFVIVGVGPNAEFVNLYSLGTTVESSLANVSVRYLIASPSRYTYLSSKRYAYAHGFEADPDKPAEKQEKAPRDCSAASPPAACATYSCPTSQDVYPYGLSAITADYMNLDAANLKQRVAGKRRLFLVGKTDTALNPEDTCPALEQGVSRHERAFNYMEHLRAESHQTAAGTATYKLSTASGAGFCVLAGVGNDHAALIASHASKRFWKDDLVDCTLSDP